MGYEYSGTVEAVGEKVVEEPIHDCDTCFQCKNSQPNVCQNFSISRMHRDSAYTDYVTVAPEHLHIVPNDVPLRHAAITEPTSIATRAVLTQSMTRPGHNVFVEGSGPIGVLTACVTDSEGANVLASGLKRDAVYRLPLLEDIGIETVNIDSGDLVECRQALTDGVGFDVVFDTTGHKSGVEMAVKHVRKAESRRRWPPGRT